MSRRAWALFAAMALLWGMPYFFIKVALAGVSPPVVSFTRLALGALILLPFAYRRHVLGRAAGDRRWLFVIGVAYMAVPLTLIPVAELFVSSSVTAILIAGVPLIVAVLSLRWRRPTAVEVVGLGLGYVGVGALVGIGLNGRPDQLLGALLLFITTILYAVGPIIISRRLGGADPLGSTAVSMTIAAALLLMPAALARPHLLPRTQILLALLALGVLCSALAYFLYFLLVQEAGPQRATLITYLNPLVAVLAGVLVLRETLSPTSILGASAIVLGSWLATRRQRMPVRSAVFRGAEIEGEPVIAGPDTKASL